MSGIHVIEMKTCPSPPMRDLDPLDPTYVADILSRPPFVNISGVTNVRDLGSYPSITHPGKMVRPQLLFRSAEVSSITEEGVDFSVSSIFIM
jgi:Tyrosine phosphatase family